MKKTDKFIQQIKITPIRKIRIKKTKSSKSGKSK